MVLIFTATFTGLACAAETNPEQPVLPAIYAGNVTDQNSKAVASGRINAYIDGVLKGSLDFQSGTYEGLLVSGSNEDENKPVTFKVEVGGMEYAANSEPAQVLWVIGDTPTVNIKADLSQSLGPAPVIPTEVKLSGVPASLTLKPEAEKQLNVTTSPSGGVVEFSTSDDGVATVSSTGLVTAVAEGTATITVNATKTGLDEDTATIQVTVSETAPEVLEKVIKLTLGQLAATVDDNSYTLDAAPYVTDAGRTLVPIRFVGEALGADVEWLVETRQVEIIDGETTIILPIGAISVLVNGEAVTIDSPAEITDNRTFVPIRFVSETLGAQVDYGAETKGITITR